MKYRKYPKKVTREEFETKRDVLPCVNRANKSKVVDYEN